MKILKHPLTFIFILSLFLHWYNIGNSTMIGPDDPTDYERAVRVSNGEFFPAYGFEINYLLKQNILVPGGFLYMLMSIPHFFSKNPYASIYFLGILSSLTVLVVYFLSKEMSFPKEICILSAIFMTINLHVNIFSRNLSGFNYVLLWGSLFFWVLLRTIKNPSCKSQILLLPLFCLTIQIDLAHFALLAAIFFNFLLLRRKPSLKYQLIGIGICVILYLPYLADLIVHRFEHIKDIIANIGPGLFYDEPQKALKALRWPISFATPELTEYILFVANDFYKTNYLRISMLLLSFTFGTAILFFPIFSFIKEGVITSFKKHIYVSFLLISISSVICVNLVRLANCQPWYLHTIIPLITILQAVGLYQLYHQRNLIKRIILCCLASLFIFTSISEFFFYLSFNEKNMHGTIKNHIDAIKYMQETSNNNYQITSYLDTENLNGLYMIAKYYFKILPKHPEGGEILPFNYVNLPLPDDKTITFYFHQEYFNNTLPQTIEKKALSKKTFGAIELYRLN